MPPLSVAIPLITELTLPGTACGPTWGSGAVVLGPVCTNTQGEAVFGVKLLIFGGVGAVQARSSPVGAPWDPLQCVAQHPPPSLLLGNHTANEAAPDGQHGLSGSPDYFIAWIIQRSFPQLHTSRTDGHPVAQSKAGEPSMTQLLLGATGGG